MELKTDEDFVALMKEQGCHEEVTTRYKRSRFLYMDLFKPLEFYILSGKGIRCEYPKIMPKCSVYLNRWDFRYSLTTKKMQHYDAIYERWVPLNFSKDERYFSTKEEADHYVESYIENHPEEVKAALQKELKDKKRQVANAERIIKYTTKDIAELEKKLKEYDS